MITKIRTIIEGSPQNEIGKYITALGSLIIKYTELESNLNDNYFKSNTFEFLKNSHSEMFKELEAANYQHSYANPDYCVEVFGKDFGQLYSAVYSKFRSLIKFAFRHQKHQIDLYSEFFLHFSMLAIDSSYVELKKAFKEFNMSTLKEQTLEAIESKASAIKTFGETWLNDVDLTDLRYLFRYGVHITDNEIKTAEFLASYDNTELQELMDMTAAAYVKGFEVDGKDVTLRKNVHILYNVGQERMIKVLKDSFNKNNLNGFYGNANYTSANKQYEYDHRFDKGLYLDDAFKSKYLEVYSEVLDLTKDDTLNYSGIMYFDKFGEAPFSPISKENNIVLTDAQAKLSQNMNSEIRIMSDKYFKGNETSFCIIAFPVPEIGENFEAIYADTCKINKLSSEAYLPIQQKIIDALDQSEYVHIKGTTNNQTDIKVMNQKLIDPSSNSNYYNCGADVNIPVGEIFTSPQLKGTEGKLHLDVVYLNDLKFIDLVLTFKDGYISNYDCNNFEAPAENKKFIEENLLFPHKTLPLGEFAIGTNTLAYVIAEKYDIVDILPILIVEKMGPHFAIGDTCYTFAEDIDVYNPDGKCIRSRDNEHSIVRKEDISKAYTNIHTDITLPYDSLEFIDGIKTNGERISIIKKGRFSLPGTEKLNEAFK